jgi:hypothetical protein
LSSGIVSLYVGAHEGRAHGIQALTPRSSPHSRSSFPSQQPHRRRRKSSSR